MLAVRNGIKSALRTPWKTVLFTLIFAVLAALLSVAFCVYAAVRGYLNDCNDYFHTIVQMEYLGKDYPSDLVYDSDLEVSFAEYEKALQALTHRDEVLSFEAADPGLALVDGLVRKDLFTYDPDMTVLQVYLMYYDEAAKAFTGSVEYSFYAREKAERKMVMIRLEDNPDPEAPRLEKGSTYLVTGRFFQGESSYLWLKTEPMTLLRGGRAATVPAFTRLSEATEKERNLYLALADQMAAQNNSCRLYRTDELEDYLPFHQQALKLQEGRTFTEAEYASKAKVCVISGRIAESLGVHAGDTLGLSLLSPEGDSYRGVDAAPEPQLYEIVGIYTISDSYPFWVFLPDAEAGNRALRPVNGYQLGQFRVRNDRIRQFLDAAEPLTQAGYRFSAYDQGYAAATEPMEEMLMISILFLGICMLLAVAALCVQCHLFVSRQSEAALTMLAMGSGRGHLFLYFLSGATALAVPAAIVGAVAGRMLEHRVLSLLQRFAAQFVNQDLRFSTTELTLTRTLEFAPAIRLWVYLAAGVTLLLGSWLFTALFTVGTIREQAKREQRKKPVQKQQRVYRGHSSRLSGRLKYTLLSIRRNRVRTAAVIALGLIVALFFGQLTSSMDGYRRQLAAVKQNTVIRGYATDLSGNKISSLVINTNQPQQVLDSGLLADFNITQSICHVSYVGIAVTADDTFLEPDPPNIPTDSFGIETLFGKMAFEPAWIRTSSIEGNPLFYYNKAESIQWAPGFREESFQGWGQICALPKTMMDRYGIHLGDAVRFLFATKVMDNPYIDTTTLLVAASYVSTAEKEVILSPIHMHLNGDGLSGSPVLGYYYNSRSAYRPYESFLFTLNSTAQLDELRQALDDAGFHQPRSGERGTYALIDDAAYLNTTRSMERQIQYVSLLYTSLYVLAGIIGFVLCWLLINSRYREIALMRALGTQPGRIVLNFLAEQLLLCAIGLAAGAGIWKLWKHGLGKLHLTLIALFLAVWSLAALIGLLAGFRKKTNASLAEPD